MGKSLVVITATQFIFFAIYNNVKNYFSDIAAEKEVTVRIKEFNKQAVEAPCAYCSEVNFIPIRLDVDNNFECKSCGKTSAVYVSLTTAQKTHMVDTSRLNVSSMIEDKLRNEIQDK